MRADEPVRASRLALCDVTARTLAHGLGLLGIEAPERCDRRLRGSRRGCFPTRPRSATTAGCRSAVARSRPRGGVRHPAVRLRRAAPPRPLPRGGRRVRPRPARSTRPRRSCAGRWRASPTTRGCGSTSPPAASCTSRSPPACRHRRCVCTATTRASTSCDGRSPSGVGHIVVDSFDEIDRLDALAADGAGAAPDVLLRITPGVHAHTHEFIATGQDDSKFGFNLANGDAERAVERALRSSRCASSACTATSARTCSRRPASPRRPR